jgi:hypothetical protein
MALLAADSTKVGFLYNPPCKCPNYPLLFIPQVKTYPYLLINPIELPLVEMLSIIFKLVNKAGLLNYPIIPVPHI